MKATFSPKELAQATGVSESSIKRWADDGRIRVVRTAGGHRRIPMEEVIRWIRDAHAHLVRPELLGLKDVTAAQRAGASGDDALRFYEHLVEGRDAEARGLILSLYLSGKGVAQIVDGPLRSAMGKIGNLWKHEEEGLFLEHRATDICIQALGQLRLLLPSREKGPRALGGSPAGDVYILPSLAVATVLRAEGFRSANLGPDTPLDTLLLASESIRPRLVWLSVSTVGNEKELREEIRRLADSLAKRGIVLCVGGAKVETLRLDEGPHLVTGSTMGELSAFAKGSLFQRAS
jgi:excisionase family DNA binding protein